MTLHTNVTSCSSPLQAVPVSPAASASGFAKPKRHLTRRFVFAMRFPHATAVKSMA